MYLPEGNFTGNDTTLEIILFEVSLNRHSSTGRVGIIGRKCLWAKAESKKQYVDLESTSVQMGIGWRWSRAHTRGEIRGIQRELGSERADALRYIRLIVAQMSSTRPLVSQTSFGHISINSSSILTVLMATESPWKDLSIGISHVSRRSIMAKILGRSTGNYHGTVY